MDSAVGIAISAKMVLLYFIVLSNKLIDIINELLIDDRNMLAHVNHKPLMMANTSANLNKTFDLNIMKISFQK